MSAEENKALANRIVDEVWNKGKLNVVDEVYATEAVIYGPFSVDPSSELGGPEALKQLVTTYRRAFPDLHIDVKDVIAKEDYVTTRWRTQPEGWVMIGITIRRIANGKIEAEWNLWDTRILLEPAEGVAVVKW